MTFRRFALLISCLLATSCHCGNKSGQAAQTEEATAVENSWYPTIKTGARAPKFEVRDTLGNVIKLSSLKGSFALIDFWASFCPDCREEFPAVKALYDKYSPKGVKFLGISFDNREDAWKECLADEDFPFPQGSNLIKWKENPINESYGIRWIPTLMLLAPDGTVLRTALTAAEMDEAIASTVHFK